MRPRQTAPEGTAPLVCQRLDRWIWHARFHRTREASAELVRAGHVRLDGRRILQPGYSLRAGQVLTLALPARTIVVEVVGFAERRGDPEAARKLYHVVHDSSSRPEA